MDTFKSCLRRQVHSRDNAETKKHIPQTYIMGPSKHMFQSYSRSIFPILKTLPFFNDSDAADVDSSGIFWMRFGKEAMNGVLKDEKILKQLCDAMYRAKIRESERKGKQNMRFGDELDDFVTALCTFSTRSAKLFIESLGGRSIRSIRQCTAKSSGHVDWNISAGNVESAKELIRVVAGYNGPLVGMTDCTKAVHLVVGHIRSVFTTNVSNHQMHYWAQKWTNGDC